MNRFATLLGMVTPFLLLLSPGWIEAQSFVRFRAEDIQLEKWGNQRIRPLLEEKFFDKIRPDLRTKVTESTVQPLLQRKNTSTAVIKGQQKKTALPRAKKATTKNSADFSDVTFSEIFPELPLQKKDPDFSLQPDLLDYRWATSSIISGKEPPSTLPLKQKKTVLAPNDRVGSDLAQQKKVSKPNETRELDDSKDSEPNQPNSKRIVSTGEDLYDLNPNQSSLLQRSHGILQKENRAEPLLAIRAQLKNGNYEEAVKALQGMTPPSPEQLYLLGQTYAYLHKYNEAIEQFTRVARQFPGHEFSDDALVQAGRLYLRQENSVAAFQLFQEILQEYPKGDRRDDSLFYLGKIYSESTLYQNPIQAKAMFSQIVSEFQGEGRAKEKNKPYSPYYRQAKKYIETLFP